MHQPTEKQIYFRDECFKDAVATRDPDTYP
jgi:hypothetical protein